MGVTIPGDASSAIEQVLSLDTSWLADVSCWHVELPLQVPWVQQAQSECIRPQVHLIPFCRSCEQISLPSWAHMSWSSTPPTKASLLLQDSACPLQGSKLAIFLDSSCFSSCQLQGAAAQRMTRLVRACALQCLTCLTQPFSGDTAASSLFWQSRAAGKTNSASRALTPH